MFSLIDRLSLDVIAWRRKFYFKIVWCLSLSGIPRKILRAKCHFPRWRLEELIAAWGKESCNRRIGRHTTSTPPTRQPKHYRHNTNTSADTPLTHSQNTIKLICGLRNCVFAFKNWFLRHWNVALFLRNIARCSKKLSFQVLCGIPLQRGWSCFKLQFYIPWGNIA